MQVAGVGQKGMTDAPVHLFTLVIASDGLATAEAH